MQGMAEIISGTPSRVLVIQLKRIGDLILTTPALSVLREECPAAEVTVLAGGSCAGLLPMIPATRAFALGEPGFWSWVRSRYDCCLDFTGTDRSALFSILSRAPLRATFKRFGKKFRHRIASNIFVDSSVRERHTADHYTDLLQALQIRREGVPLWIEAPPLTPKVADRLPAGRYLVLHAGTARPEKYWLAPRWAEVARALAARFGLGIVLTGSQDPHEQSHIREILGHLAPVPCLDLSGATSLAELAAIIRGAALFCGVDTAAMHLADAAGVPLVALFGPTNPFHWRPRCARSIVLRAGVTPPFYPGQQGAPLDAIPVEDVVAAGISLLSGHP